MIEFKILKTEGLLPAIYGMRLSHQSQDFMDTINEQEIGSGDMKLITKLLQQHSSHRKFLRQIQIWADISMPLDWWFEFDTYIFAIKSKDEYARLSDSTMHNLKKYMRTEEFDDHFNSHVSQVVIDNMVQLFEDGADITTLKANLPCGFILRSIINFNYESAINIYKQRYLHKLKWWKYACNAIIELPHMKEFIDASKGI